MSWGSLPGLLDDLADSWDSAIPSFSSASAAYNSALAEWNAGNDHMAISYILAGLTHSEQGIDYMLRYIWTWTPKTTLAAVLYKMRDEYADGNGEVTMDAILTAMITADFEQLQKFVGIEDAYRVSLWNEPFNSEFYAALARGFMK